MTSLGSARSNRQGFHESDFQESETGEAAPCLGHGRVVGVLLLKFSSKLYFSRENPHRGKFLHVSLLSCIRIFIFFPTKSYYM